MIKFRKLKQKIKLKYDQSKLKMVCHKYGIELLILHGSYARGYSTKISDIDVGLLIGNRSMDKEHLPIIRDLNLLFGDKCDPAFLNHAESMVIRQVALYGIPLYERRKGLFNQFKVSAISRYQDAIKFRELERIYLQKNI